MATYLTADEYSKALTTRLDEFYEALTFRWREEACKALSKTVFDVPGAPEPLRWQPPPESHGHLVASIADCPHLSWVRDGQVGEVPAEACEGWNKQSQEYVECRVADVLARVADWAWDKREEVAKGLPQLEVLELGELEDVYDTFVGLGGRLGLQTEGPDKANLPPLGSRPLLEDVEWLGGNDGNKEWFAGWTGLAASTVKDGFLASVKPTLHNQSVLLGCLAELYSDRAKIVHVARNNTVQWLAAMAKALNAKQTVKVFPDAGKGKLALDTVGQVLSVVGLLGKTVSAATGPAGVVVGLLGFLAGGMSEATMEVHAKSLPELLTQMDTDVRSLHAEMDATEAEYLISVGTVQSALGGVHSYNFELYDLTRNDPDGDCSDPPASKGYSVDVAFVLDIAQRCYEAAEGYAGLLSKITTTASADRQLAGRDGHQIEADKEVLAIRDTLESFFETSGARYLLAGDQIKEAAKEYAQTDADQAERYREKMKDWREERISGKRVDLDPRKPGVQSDPDGHTGPTDRGEVEPEEDQFNRGEHGERRREDGKDYRTS